MSHDVKYRCGVRTPTGSPSPSADVPQVPHVHPASDHESPPTARVLAVLEYLGAATGDVAPSELVKHLGITKSTSRLVLATLTRGGYAQRSPDTGKYRIGPAAVALGRVARDRTPLLVVVSAVLQRFCMETDVGCSIYARAGADLFVLERIGRTFGSEAGMGRTGVRLPFAAPFGLPFASFLPPAELEAWFRHVHLTDEMRTLWAPAFEAFRTDGFQVRSMPLEIQRDVDAVVDRLADTLAVVDQLVDTLAPPMDSFHHAALLAELLPAFERSNRTGQMLAQSIAIAALDNAGRPELGIVFHIPDDNRDRGELIDIARRVKALLDSASRLVYGH